MKRNFLVALNVAAVLAVALAGQTFAAGLDATDELGDLAADLLSTLTTNIPLILAIGFASIGLWAGVNYVFFGGRKGAKQKA